MGCCLFWISIVARCAGLTESRTVSGYFPAPLERRLPDQLVRSSGRRGSPDPAAARPTLVKDRLLDRKSVV